MNQYELDLYWIVMFICSKIKYYSSQLYAISSLVL